MRNADKYLIFCVSVTFYEWTNVVVDRDPFHATVTGWRGARLSDALLMFSYYYYYYYYRSD